MESGKVRSLLSRALSAKEKVPQKDGVYAAEGARRQREAERDWTTSARVRTTGRGQETGQGPQRYLQALRQRRHRSDPADIGYTCPPFGRRPPRGVGAEEPEGREPKTSDPPHPHPPTDSTLTRSAARNGRRTTTAAVAAMGRDRPAGGVRRSGRHNTARDLRHRARALGRTAARPHPTERALERVHGVHTRVLQLMHGPPSTVC